MIMADNAIDVGAQDGATGEEGAQRAQGAAAGDDGPAEGKPVDEARDGGGGGVANDGGERGDEDEEEDDEPAAGEGAPVLGHGAEPGEEGVRVEQEDDAEREHREAGQHREEALQRRQAEEDLDDLLAQKGERCEHALGEGVGS